MSKKNKAKAGKEETKQFAADKPAKKPAPAKSKSFSEDDQRFVLVSRALADPTRMSIVRKIAAGQGRCGDVRECLGVSAATLSHHMKELEHAGLVTLQREGRFVNATMEKKAWKRYIADLKELIP